MTVNPIPDGYRTLTPYLAVRDGSAAIDFYVRGLGATVKSRMDAPDGTVMHAELVVGDSIFQLGEQMPDYGIRAPEAGWVHSSSVVYVEDTDGVVERLVQAGATVVMPVQDTFSGDRHGVVIDPFGHRWAVCTKIENVPDAEIARRAVELFFTPAQ